jgi:hypothetical protein
LAKFKVTTLKLNKMVEIGAPHVALRGGNSIKAKGSFQ